VRIITLLDDSRNTPRLSTINHLFSVTCAQLCYAFLGNKHNIFLSDNVDNNNAMTIDGVPGASCGEGETHVVFLAAFTAGLKVKDSHRGNARLISESGRFPFFLWESRAFLVPSSSYRSLTTVHCPTWCFAAPPWLRPPSTPTEPSDGASINRDPYYWWTYPGDTSVSLALRASLFIGGHRIRRSPLIYHGRIGVAPTKAHVEILHAVHAL